LQYLKTELGTLKLTQETLRKRHSESLAERDRECLMAIEQAEAGSSDRERNLNQKMVEQAEQAQAQRELDAASHKLEVEELEATWTTRCTELESRLTGEMSARQELIEEHTKLQEAHAKVQEESTAMLRVYEQALESALTALAEERERQAVENRAMKAEVMQTIEGLGQMANDVNSLVQKEYIGHLSQGMSMDSVEGKLRLKKLNIIERT